MNILGGPKGVRSLRVAPFAAGELREKHCIAEECFASRSGLVESWVVDDVRGAIEHLRVDLGLWCERRAVVEGGAIGPQSVLARVHRVVRVHRAVVWTIVMIVRGLQPVRTS